MKIARIACAFAVVALVFSLLPAFAQNRLDAEFQKFWAARSPSEAERLVDGILKTGITFDEALKRLKLGRTYTAQPTGVVKLSNRTKDGIEHNYALNIPPSYDPAKRYQVRYQLHGGVGGRTDNKPRGTGEIGALAGAEQIYVIPYSWADEPWWSDDQILNLDAILDSLKRTYNVDENRVVVAGVSDGGTGAYYVAMRETTPFASFLPLNGFVMVLASEEIDDGGVFPNNLRNKPLFVINGGRDPLYPTSDIEPFVMHFKSGGVETAYYPQPEAGHNTAWWPEMKDTFEKFVTDHPRNSDPDKLTWETATTSHNRAHWIVIDELGKQPDDKPMSDMNVAGNISLFLRRKAPGRVALVRTGNTIQATTNNVTAFTLLLSPDKFDFSKPIKVVANGREVFNNRVERSVKTLMQWAARDNDRTMLYAAELKIKLSR